MVPVVRSHLLFVAAVLVLLAGCSGSDERAEGAARDQIVIANAAGEVFLVAPDGSNRVDLAPGGPSARGLHPVWSRDGTRIAWSQQAGAGFSVSSANPDGSERVDATAPFPGYFGYWDPTSTQLAFLGGASPGTGLVLDDGSGAPLDEVVDSDTFYFFSWSPDGSQWFVNGGSGFSIVDLDGTTNEVDLTAAQFRAPVWAPDGSVVLALQLDGQNVIASYDPESGDVKSLVRVGELANFVLDPTGRFLAIESLEFAGDGSQSGDAVQVAFRQPTTTSQVLVYDLETDTTMQAFDGQSAGFWWSPNGERLALLVPEEGANPSAAQWLVWGPDASFRTERFRPSQPYVTSYIPFFDQYAQSITPWSPDSSRFVYTGATQDGASGVFVQPAQPDTAAELIANDNGVAFWSPT